MTLHLVPPKEVKKALYLIRLVRLVLAGCVRRAVTHPTSNFS